MSSLVPKCRQPVGHALMQAGSRPAPTRSEQSVHLYTFFVLGLNFGILKGQPETQNWQPIQFSCWKSTMPLEYCTIDPSGGQASGIFAVHALVFAHEPRKAAIVVLVLVELDEVPVIPVGVGHRLVGVVEVGFLERHVVPFHASYFAGFATDAGGGVDQLAHLVLALRAFAGYRSRMGRDLLDS